MVNGSTNGYSTNALFSDPAAIVSDPAGNLLGMTRRDWLAGTAIGIVAAAGAPGLARAAGPQGQPGPIGPTPRT